MNAVEIEEAVEQLVAQPFDRGEFPFQFLTASLENAASQIRVVGRATA